jgi:hypothetical protein
LLNAAEKLWRSAGGRPAKPTAVVVSLALHLLLVTAFLIQPRGMLGSAGGEFVRGTSGESGGGEISVSLVSLKALAAMAAASPSAAPAVAPSSPLDRLMAQTALQTPMASRTFDAPSENKSKTASLDLLIAEADHAAKGASSDKAAKATKAGAGNGPKSGGQGARGDLFAEVEPCWRRALDTSRVPVSLEIMLDGRGMAAGPPRLVHTGPGDREATRIAVERALQAVAACLPYRGDGPKGGRYVVEFGLSGG